MRRTRTRLLASLLMIALPAAPLLLTSGCTCGVGKHDKLVRLETEVDRKWADLQGQFQRRANLLPNAVKIVKARAGSEKDILTGIAEARASATQVKLTAADLNDPAKLETFRASQTQVAQSFGRLMEIHEKYPELKSDQGFQDLMTQLEGTENRINIAVQEYNKAVADYNAELKIVSGKALDAITGDEMFQPRAMYEAQAGAEIAPDLDI